MTTTPPITVEFRTFYFAQHLGQRCIFTGKGRPTSKLGPVTVITPDTLYLCAFLPQRALILKPLGSITNDHAEAVYFISGGTKELNPDHELRIAIGREIVDDVAMQAHNKIPGWLWLRVWDYLRRAGYALPFFHMDVPDLVQAGILQLEFDPQ